MIIQENQQVTIHLESLKIYSVLLAIMSVGSKDFQKAGLCYFLKKPVVCHYQTFLASIQKLYSLSANTSCRENGRATRACFQRIPASGVGTSTELALNRSNCDRCMLLMEKWGLLSQAQASESGYIFLFSLKFSLWKVCAGKMWTKYFSMIFWLFSRGAMAVMDKDC